MKALCHLVNVAIWLLIVPAFTFLLSFVFQYDYVEAVHSGGFVVFYTLYAIIVMGLYLASTDEPNKPMSFL